MEPKLDPQSYIFCCVGNKKIDEIAYLNPLMTFREKEGLTLILEKEDAIWNNIQFESVYRLITLSVHSSLDAVGLTASFSEKLASRNISANVISAYFHDHIFVQEHKAEEALKALYELQSLEGKQDNF